MGEHEEAKKPKDYDDFITEHPEPIIFLNGEQESLVKEYLDIIRALIGRNMTVKEVHALYWNPDKEEYDKTIKTVYRHLEILQEAQLVKECGHRKPHDSRLTEKLFCRTANVFILGDDETKPKWWESEKGKRLIQKVSILAGEFLDVSLEGSATFSQLMQQFLDQQEKMMMELYRKTRERKAMADIFSKENLYEIKYLTNLVATLGLMLRNPELCEQFRKVLTK